MRATIAPSRPATTGNIEVSMIHVPPTALIPHAACSDTSSTTHAQGATAVVVRLDWSSRSLRITVNDDGDGYDESERRPGGPGLSGIAERAGRLGANVDFSGEPGLARIAIMVPFVRQTDDN